LQTDVTVAEAYDDVVDADSELKEKVTALLPYLNERQRRRFFQENERRTSIGVSVLDDERPRTVKTSAHGPVLLVAEGVFVYFEEADVRRLFTRLLNELPGACLAFDAMSTWWICNQHKHDSLKHLDATIHWGIDDVADLEWWDSRYRVDASVTLGQVSHRFRRHVPIHYRVLGDVVGLIFPKQTRGYRLNLVRLDGVEAASDHPSAPARAGKSAEARTRPSHRGWLG
jgi:hypothetical protein